MFFTDTQQRILRILADGEPHKREELVLSFTDKVSNPKVLDNHLSAMRKELRRCGQDIICQFIKRSNHFRLIALVGDCAIRTIKGQSDTL